MINCLFLMTIRLKEEASAWNRVEAWFVFSYKLGPTYDVIVVSLVLQIFFILTH